MWTSLAPFRALRGDERMNHVSVQFRFEAVVRGREVKKGPPTMPGTFGNPVKEQAHPYSGGRVR